MTANSRSLTLSLLRGRYAVLRFMPAAVAPAWAMNGKFRSVTRSKHEHSVVTNLENLPSWQVAGPYWHLLECMDLVPLQKSECSPVWQPTGKDQVGNFVISRFDTDFRWVQVDQSEKLSLRCKLLALRPCIANS